MKNSEGKEENIFSQMSEVDLQFKAAAEVALSVKEQFKNAPTISVTGHMLGGGLASYAAEQAGINKARTFNATISPLFTRTGGNDQVNVVTLGEYFRDSDQGRAIAGGGVSGKTHVVW
jgi:hypothetical protein